MNPHNVGTVIAFEVQRTLRKPTFWAATLAVPLFLIAAIALSFLSNTSAIAAASANDAEPTSFVYADASGIIVPEVATRLGGTPTADPDAAAQAVREGRADLFISIPADLSAGIEVIGRDIGLLDSTRWNSVARQLLFDSASARIDNAPLIDALSGVPITTELWAEGGLSQGWGAAVVPGMFLVLLFMALVLLGQQMLNIATEEKENRVSEMILTTIDPAALVAGKVIGVVILGIIQGILLMTPVLAWALLPQESAVVGTVTSEFRLVIDPATLLAAAALAFAGFLLIIGLLVAIGSIMPTAQDAGGAFAALIIGAMVPIYILPLVLQTPDAPLSVGLTLFPITAPVTALGRLAVGALPFWQGALAFALVTATALVALRTGIRLFREGSVAYGQRLSLKRLLSRSRTP
ncbi:MAG: ABC transporter permease [Propioniciclava sp.]